MRSNIKNSRTGSERSGILTPSSQLPPPYSQFSEEEEEYTREQLKRLAARFMEQEDIETKTSKELKQLNINYDERMSLSSPPSPITPTNSSRISSISDEFSYFPNQDGPLTPGSDPRSNGFAGSERGTIPSDSRSSGFSVSDPRSSSFSGSDPRSSSFSGSDPRSSGFGGSDPRSSSFSGSDSRSSGFSGSDPRSSSFSGSDSRSGNMEQRSTTLTSSERRSNGIADQERRSDSIASSEHRSESIHRQDRDVDNRDPRNEKVILENREKD